MFSKNEYDPHVDPKSLFTRADRVVRLIGLTTWPTRAQSFSDLPHVEQLTFGYLL